MENHTDPKDPTTHFIASVMGDDDELVDVDVRTLDTDVLRVLRDEAGAAGDEAFVRTITSVIEGR